MITCKRCGYSGPAGAAVCPRCGQPFAQAAPPRPTLLLRLESPELPTAEWEITDRAMGIGRLDDSDIPVPHKSVSRQHARILPTASGFDVEDLGSTNGTWLNEKQIIDRTPLSNGDRLTIGDVPLRVTLRSAAAAQPIVITPAPVESAIRVEPRTPPPLPAPTPGGPSTVFYDIDEALAAAHPVETATATDITPAPSPTSGAVVEQATLIAADPVTPTPVAPVNEPRATPSFDPRPTPQPDARTVLPTQDAQPMPTYEPRPTAQPEPRPMPTFEPRPAPRTAPADAATGDLSGVALVDLADRLATALHLLKGDTALAVWLFEHAGGQPAARAFIQQVERAEANPDNPIEQARLLEMAPTAARLLEAAAMLTSVVSSLRGPDDETQTDAPNLDPVPRS